MIQKDLHHQARPKVFCLHKGKRGEGYTFLQYPSKAYIWVLNTMCKHAAENSAASKILGTLLSFNRAEVRKSDVIKLLQLVMSLLPSSFNTHPKSPYISQIQCTNILQKNQWHPKIMKMYLSLKLAWP